MQVIHICLFIGLEMIFTTAKLLYISSIAK